MTSIAAEAISGPVGRSDSAIACPAMVAPAGARTEAYSASGDVDALVLRAIAARMRDRALPRRLQRLADLDADRLTEIAGSLEEEYAR